MTAEAFLSSIVEIGIGTAGFAGIIAAVRQRDVSTWDPHQRVLLQVLFTASAVAILFSLLPSILAEGGLAGERLWRIGSAAMAGWFIVAPAYRLYQTTRPGVRFPLSRAVLVVVIPLLGLQIWNTQHGAPWPYLLGIMGILTNAFATFLALLFGNSDSDT